MPKSKTLSAFDKWWDSWLEREHYYEACNVDEYLVELIKEAAKAAWNAVPRGIKT